MSREYITQLKQASVGQIKCHVALHLDAPVELNTHDFAFELSRAFAPERGCYTEAQFSDAIEAHYSELFNKSLSAVVDAHGNTPQLDSAQAILLLKALSEAMQREGSLLDTLLTLWKPVALECGLHPTHDLPTDPALLDDGAWLHISIARDGELAVKVHNPSYKK